MWRKSKAGQGKRDWLTQKGCLGTRLLPVSWIAFAIAEVWQAEGSFPSPAPKCTAESMSAEDRTCIDYVERFVRFPTADLVALLPRLASRSFRNVCSSRAVLSVLLVLLVLLELVVLVLALVVALLVLVVLLDALLALAVSIAETRLAKSDSNLVRLLSVEEVDDVEEVEEPSRLLVSSEIRFSSLLVKVE